MPKTTVVNTVLPEPGGPRGRGRARRVLASGWTGRWTGLFRVGALALLLAAEVGAKKVDSATGVQPQCSATVLCHTSESGNCPIRLTGTRLTQESLQ